MDLAVLVFSVREPDLNLQLLDKFLVHIEHAGLDTVICLTKQDLLAEAKGEDPVALVQSLYENIGYQVIVSSSRLGLGTELLTERLKGQISVFSGQSGVGKSSLLNRLVPGLELETSAISMKLGRGKHTTRHVELIELPGGGFVADTPGFSSWTFWSLASRSSRPVLGSLPLWPRDANFAAAAIPTSRVAKFGRLWKTATLQRAAMSIMCSF
ncbi:putative ribosome biogenesis GTPase RsgA [Paenibacillus sp. P1XP2]|nr:putative ribosome biogenesis GTPase RsgA [Paenibacillus sp. P1XP2]